MLDGKVEFVTVSPHLYILAVMQFYPTSDLKEFTDSVCQVTKTAVAKVILT